MIGLIAAAVAPTALRGLGANAEVAASELAAALRRARGRAINNNAEVTVMLDVDGRRYAIADLPAQDLHRDLSLSLFTAQSERLSDGVGRIRYFPDGSATGGEITVSDGRVRYVVDVDWLTGRTTLWKDGAG